MSAAPAPIAGFALCAAFAPHAAVTPWAGPHMRCTVVHGDGTVRPGAQQLTSGRPSLRRDHD